MRFLFLAAILLAFTSVAQAECLPSVRAVRSIHGNVHVSWSVDKGSGGERECYMAGWPRRHGRARLAQHVRLPPPRPGPAQSPADIVALPDDPSRAAAVAPTGSALGREFEEMIQRRDLRAQLLEYALRNRLGE
jgi:hypothetical protein